MQGWKLQDTESAGKAEYGKLTAILHTLYDMHRIIKTGNFVEELHCRSSQLWHA